MDLVPTEAPNSSQSPWIRVSENSDPIVAPVDNGVTTTFARFFLALDDVVLTAGLDGVAGRVV